jgi:hypothetical protein
MKFACLLTCLRLDDPPTGIEGRGLLSDSGRQRLASRRTAFHVFSFKQSRDIAFKRGASISTAHRGRSH